MALGTLALYLTTSQLREIIKSHTVRQIVNYIALGLHTKVSYDVIADKMIDALDSDDPEAALAELEKEFDLKLDEEIQKMQDLTGEE